MKQNYIVLAEGSNGPCKPIICLSESPKEALVFACKQLAVGKEKAFERQMTMASGKDAKFIFGKITGLRLVLLAEFRGYSFVNEVAT